MAVGGDGTIHEVANGLLGADGSGPPIAVIPVGTGNDFYRMVGAPKDLDAALQTLQHGVARSFDVGRARWPGGERYFVNLFGVGIDVEVLERRERVRRLRGLAQYLVALVSAVTRFRPLPVRVHIEGGELIDVPTMLAAVTVGPSVGGGFMLNPTATADDGFLDLCFIERLNPWQIARVLPRVIRGTHGDHRLIHVRRLRSARFESPTSEPLRFELDGELVDGSAEWIELEIVPGRLLVMVPE
jgi:diacylglycerol kinase (ATP)